MQLLLYLLVEKHVIWFKNMSHFQVKMTEVMQKSNGKVVECYYFNKFHLFKTSEIFIILLWNIKSFKSVEKRKKNLFDKFKKINLQLKLRCSDPCYAIKW